MLLVCMVLMIFIIILFGGLINESMKNFLIVVGVVGEYVYVIVLVVVIVFDLGGLINKVVGFVVFGLIIENVFLIIVRIIVIVVFLIGLGLIILLDKRLVGRRVYDR